MPEITATLVVDNQGRITIPRSIRVFLAIRPGDLIEVSIRTLPEEHIEKQS